MLKRKTFFVALGTHWLRCQKLDLPLFLAMSIRYVISLTNGFHVALRLFSITQWCKCYECRDWWSLSMIYWSTDTWMTSRLTWFLCFVQHHGARFSKCLWDYFGLASESLEKRLTCGSRATSLFLTYFDVFCDLLLINRRTATWNPFVLYNDQEKKRPMHIPSSHR